ncbi:hypothetical protein FOA43_002437 [Brettanomyces nanus]|uniref:Armadillo repeat-containing protein 8 n=1 Tax=Eeniella nana TaxID=13502 RepID=A0A875S129_EENNA|nr:uncharacterized protein FOA43_002437 [Brettanomyces nanus]QPG75096.1 hypothetical protein FOA43_002437 [Brettanomyces nanus]
MTTLLGNDKEKLSRLSSDPTLLSGFVGQLSSSDDVSILGNSAVVLTAFVRLGRTCRLEFPFSEQQLASLLISTAVRHPIELTACNLAALAELLVSGNLAAITASDDLDKLLRRVLGRRHSTPAELRHACIVLIHLRDDPVAAAAAADTTKAAYSRDILLFRPLMRRIAWEIAPFFKTIYSSNAARLDTDTEIDTDISDAASISTSRASLLPPAFTLRPQEADDAARHLTPLLQALAHLLPRIHAQVSAPPALPPPLHYTLCAFLRSPNAALRLAAATVLAYYTKDFESLPSMRAPTYAKVIPALIELADTLESTAGTPAVTPSPMRVLAVVAQEYPPACSQLFGVNFADRAASIVAETYAPAAEFMSAATVHRLSDALLVLSCVCSVNDAHRDIVAQYDLRGVLCGPIARHTALCEDLAKTPEIRDASSASALRSLRSLRLSNELTLAACYLIRALSRSASMLRTFLVDLDPVNLLVNLAAAPVPDVAACDTDLAENEVVLRSVVLGIMANLVVEFSAVREKFMEVDLYGLLLRYIGGETNAEDRTARSPRGANSRGATLLRISALQVIRNSLYSDDSLFKQKFASGSALNQIFELCEDPSDKVQQQCFNILRNISVTSFTNSAHLYDAYAASAARRLTNDDSFLEFLLRHLDAAHSSDTVIAINYILVHFASSTLQSKLLLTQNDALLRKLLELLKEPIRKSVSAAAEEKLWKVKLSIVWIVTNLTWREETSVSDSEEDVAVTARAANTADAADVLGSSDNAADAAAAHEDSAMDVDFGAITAPQTAAISSVAATSDYRKTRNRARKLIDLGFYNAIKQLNNTCQISDFKERARTAIFQLVFHDNSKR